MPSRGSAQFLLLFLRSRTKLGWTIGAVAFALIVAVLLQAGDAFPLLTRTGLAQLLRQSVWQHALAGLPEAPPLPWAITNSGTTAEVPLLGLSASVVKETNPGSATVKPVATRIRICRGPSSAKLASATASPSPRPTAPRATIASPGARWSIRIWRRAIRGPSDVDATLVTCLPLDPLLASSISLVIQATKVDPPAETEPDPEQKL